MLVLGFRQMGRGQLPNLAKVRYFTSSPVASSMALFIPACGIHHEVPTLKYLLCTSHRSSWQSPQFLQRIGNKATVANKSAFDISDKHDYPQDIPWEHITIM